jgi:hypothetical protein
MDPYVVLGVDRDARPDEIDAAFARRSRLHQPTAQESPAERAAAERYHAELADAYRALLGTSPPEVTTDARTDAGASGTRRAGARTDTATRPAPRPDSPARGLFVVVGSLVGAYLVVLIAVSVAPGIVGLVGGVVAALGLVSFMLVREHNRS